MSSQKKKEKRTCNYQRLPDKPCGRTLFDNEHCIFHSEDIERKKDKFKDDFWKEFERQREQGKIYDFGGFVFPDSIDFGNNYFDKSTSFTNAKFYGALNIFPHSFGGEFVTFRDAKFLNGKIIFRGVNFDSSRTTIFDNVEFCGELVDFENARFNSENTTFESSIFKSESIDFSRVTYNCKILNFGKTSFSGDSTSFIQAEFNCIKIFFNDVKFKNGRYFFGNTIFNSKELITFNRAEFTGKDHVFFRSSFTTNKITFEGAFIENTTALFESLREKKYKRIFGNKYKIKDFRFYLGYKMAKKHPVINRMTMDAWYLDDFKNNHPITYKLWNISSKCGQSIFIWILWSLFFALYFAINFYLIDYAFPTAFYFNEAIQERSLWSFLYYSVVTFTTLGFGDIIPTIEWVQRWVMGEVIMGYIMLGGLISIFATKLARRS